VKTSNLNLFYAGLVLLIGLTACRKERLLSKVDIEDDALGIKSSQQKSAESDNNVILSCS
jgi:hypothetical protein